MIHPKQYVLESDFKMPLPTIPKLCTTAFLVEISQYIKFGDLSNGEDRMQSDQDSPPTKRSEFRLPSFSLEADGLGYSADTTEEKLTEEEEDMLLRVSGQSTCTRLLETEKYFRTRRHHLQIGLPTSYAE
jgi:hypothetical protein